MHPDHLRPSTLVEAGGVVRGRMVTSWPLLKTDLKNAGVNWVERDVVRDNGFVTSRKPDDIPAFDREMILLLLEDLSRESRGDAGPQWKTASFTASRASRSGPGSVS